MRQIIYQSVASEPFAIDVAPDILKGARPFNGLNGVTGLLCAAHGRFLQLLEGPAESVGLALERIRMDARHHQIEILVDRPIAARAFPDWGMAYRDEGHPATMLDERMGLLIDGAPREIGELFQAFVRGRGPNA